MEFISSINKCSNLLSPGSDKLIWRHLKCIVKDNICLKKIVNIVDTYFELDYWPSHFKVSTSIIIPKPNKKWYNFPKVFKPIVFLNTIGKLIEKVISNRLQFQLISNNFIHCHIQVHLSGNNVPMVKPPPNHTSPPFLQHVSWQCCDPPDILSSMAEILLFNSVFHDRVSPVSISILKPLLGAIDVLPLKPQASPIISVCI